MRICFVSHSGGRGGAEKSLLELVDALRKRGVESRLVIPRDGPLTADLRARAIPFSVIRYPHWVGTNRSVAKRARRFVRSLGAVPRVAELVRRWKCDLVYTNTSTVCVGALAARVTGRRHVWHIHEFGEEDHGLTFDLGSRLSLYLMNRLSAACITNSHAVARKYARRLDRSKLSVVDYSVDVPLPETRTDVKPSENDGGVRCVLIGQLYPGKGQKDAILAIRELVRERIPASLILVGDGRSDYRGSLMDLVRRSDLESRVTFVGYVEDPRPYIQAADVVLMCSRSEAFGRVTVEGMKLGKPIIGTRSGGTPELVVEGETGLLYAPGDFRELAGKISFLRSHPEIACAMGRRGRRLAEARFTEDLYGNQVWRILASLEKR